MKIFLSLVVTCLLFLTPNLPNLLNMLQNFDKYFSFEFEASQT